MNTIVLLFITFLFLNAQCLSQNKTLINDLSKEELKNFLDEIIPAKLEEFNVPGAIITIVKDGEIFYSKGYGYADIKIKKLFSADSTIIRIASVSKLFTATAVMQLVEKGKIDLNEDANKYLTLFKLEEKFNSPVTIKNLLTHTGGFDDRFIGKSARTEKEQIPLGKFLKEKMPGRLIPPGGVYSYSNFSNALAAYIVEETTGKDYADYCRDNVFKPLNMNLTSYRLPDNFIPHLSKVYIYSDSKIKSVPFDFLNDYPGGQLITTGKDIANFMIAHMNKGRFNERKILDSGTVHEMHKVHFTHHPMLHSASAISFAIDSVRGFKVLSHGGGYTGISSLLELYPDINVGLFLANNIGSTDFNNYVHNALIEKYFPPEKTSLSIYPLMKLPAFDKNIDRYTGNYRFTRYPSATFDKIGVLVGMVGFELPIWKNDAGMLMMYDHLGTERRLIQIEPLLFQSIDDDYYMAFKSDKDGNITHLFTNGINAFEKIPWYYSTSLQSLLLYGIFIFFAVNLLFGLFLSIKRKIKKEPKLKRNLLARLSRNISSIFLTHFGLLGLVIMILTPEDESAIGFAYGLPPAIYLVQVLPHIAIILTAALGYLLIRNIIAKKLSSFELMFFSFFLFVCFCFIWFLDYWNLLGWRF